MPFQVGDEVTEVTVAVTGPLESDRVHVTEHRPVESVVHVRVTELLNRSTILTVMLAPFTARPVSVRTIFTLAMALYWLLNDPLVLMSSSVLMVLRSSVVVVVGAVVVVVGMVVVVVGAVVVVVVGAAVVVVGTAVVVVEAGTDELTGFVSIPLWGRSPMSSLAVE